jgi:hypothetical protein
MGREPILQPNFDAYVCPKSSDILKGMCSHLKKLIFKPENSSNPIRIHCKISTLSSMTSKKIRCHLQSADLIS